MFDPPLPPNLAFDLYITEAAIIAELHTLDFVEGGANGEKPTTTGAAAAAASTSAFFDISPFGFRERFEAAVGIHRGGEDGSGRTAHGVRGNPDEVFTFRGAQVKVRETVRVESQDPSLMAAWAKLGGLEHVLGSTLKSLRLVMTAAGVE